MNFQEFLTAHGLSPSDKTAEQAWQQCSRADWMIWIVSHIVREQELTHEIVRVAADIARAALTHTTDSRAHDCVAAVDRWLAGEPADLQAAAEAAGAAPLGDSSKAASETAAWAAWAALAVSGTAAAGCAQMAMDWAAAADTMPNRVVMWVAACAAAQARHADIIRKHIPWATIQPLLERAMQEVS